MDRHFLIPVSVAAALHAGLLLGPGAPAKTVPAPVKTVPCFDAFDFLKPFELTPPEEVPDETRASSGAISAAPTLDELFSDPAVNDFVIKVPDVPPTVVSTHVSTLPLGPIGPDSIPGDAFRPSGPKVINFGDLENTPRTRTQSSPIYPFEAKRDGREGRVTVEFMVDESGAVIAPHVVESTDRVFDEAAVRAVAKWRFEPGRRDGRNVRFRMAVPIVFALNAN